MDEIQYDEQFSHSELGRSGNEVIDVSRDVRSNQDQPQDPEEQTPDHFDVIERNAQEEIEKFHVIDEQQTWMNDF